MRNTAGQVGDERVELIGRYALCGEIASGGMATVHFGRLLGPMGFSRPVAIKKLHPQFAKDPRVRTMFIDEARLAARISHPNVVRTLDVVATDGQLLLVMEYVHGEALSSIARTLRDRGEPVPVRIALAIASNILHGLHAAHEARTETGEPLHIVHRDISPHNILVGIDGVARVLDFGIAHAAVRLEHTSEGVVKGKLAYMAPEQLGSSLVTKAADIYATGVVLWELLAGRRLFFKADEGVMLEKIIRGAIESPSTHNPDVPCPLDALVLRALQRAPDKRFATAREMALALEAIGPLAVSSEVGAWVEHWAPDVLDVRARTLEEFERTSSELRVAPATPEDFAADASPPPYVTSSTSPFAISERPGQPVDSTPPGAHPLVANDSSLRLGAPVAGSTTVAPGQDAAPARRPRMAWAIACLATAAALALAVRSTPSRAVGTAALGPPDRATVAVEMPPAPQASSTPTVAVTPGPSMGTAAPMLSPKTTTNAPAAATSSAATPLSLGQHSRPRVRPNETGRAKQTSPDRAPATAGDSTTKHTPLLVNDDF